MGDNAGPGSLFSRRALLTGAASALAKPALSCYSDEVSRECARRPMWSADGRRIVTDLGVIAVAGEPSPTELRAGPGLMFAGADWLSGSSRLIATRNPAASEKAPGLCAGTFDGAKVAWRRVPLPKGRMLTAPRCCPSRPNLVAGMDEVAFPFLDDGVRLCFLDLGGNGIPSVFAPAESLSPQGAIWDGAGRWVCVQQNVNGWNLAAFDTARRAWKISPSELMPAGIQHVSSYRNPGEFLLTRNSYSEPGSALAVWSTVTGKVTPVEVKDLEGETSLRYPDYCGRTHRSAVIVSEAGKADRLLLLDHRSGEQSVLLETRPRSLEYASWSPDGKRIAFWQSDWETDPSTYDLVVLEIGANRAMKRFPVMD